MAIRIDKANACSGKPQKGTICLRDTILGKWPTAWSGGIYNCRDVRGGFTTSTHGEGRAVDIMTADIKQGDAIAAWVVSNARAYQIQRVIWNRRLWESESGWREYKGLHPHTDHVHIEQNWDGAMTCGTSGFRPYFAGAAWWQYAIVGMVAVGLFIGNKRKNKQ